MSVAVKKLTYWEFRELEFDQTNSNLYELLKGAIVKKAAPSLIHQDILANILVEMRLYTRQKESGKVLPAPLDVVLDEENAPQPDLVYISKENRAVINMKEQVILGTPDLVVEILSPGTAKRDKTLKKIFTNHLA